MSEIIWCGHLLIELTPVVVVYSIIGIVLDAILWLSAAKWCMAIRINQPGDEFYY